MLLSSEYFHYKIFIREKCLENENDRFQKSLSRPSIIDARAHYWAAARRLRNIGLDNRLTDSGEVVSLMRRPLVTPRNILSVRDW
jgi:hypothetical protein